MPASLACGYGVNNEAPVPAVEYPRTWYRRLLRAAKTLYETAVRFVTQPLTVLLSYRIVASVPLVPAEVKWKIASVGRN